MERYLLSYLREIANNPIASKWIENLKVDLDGFIYAYGDNTNENYPMPRSIDWQFYARLFKQLVRCENGAKNVGNRNNVLSFVSLPKNFEIDYNTNLLGSIVQPVGEKLIYSKTLLAFYLFYAKLVRTKHFNEIITKDNLERLEYFEEALFKEYSKYNFKALFVGNGEPFMFKLHLDIFKKLNVPSFIFLHGIPGIYNLETEKKADYMLVWGEKIRDNYIDAGFNPERVIVVGHPKYQTIPNIEKLRNDLSSVLVCTTASVYWSPHGWEAAKFPLYDRSQIVLYAYSVQTVLQKLGVKKAKLRVHPSVGKEWIAHFVDSKFYTIDYSSMQDSVNASSLVIGPTSTMWLNCLLEGVNYLIYEPKLDGVNNNLVPPFDGSDSRIQIADSEDTLYQMLYDKYLLNLDIIKDYIEPFDFGKVKELIDMRYNFEIE